MIEKLNKYSKDFIENPEEKLVNKINEIIDYLNNQHIGDPNRKLRTGLPRDIMSFSDLPGKHDK